MSKHKSIEITMTRHDIDYIMQIECTYTPPSGSKTGNPNEWHTPDDGLLEDVEVLTTHKVCDNGGEPEPVDCLFSQDEIEQRVSDKVRGL